VTASVFHVGEQQLQQLTGARERLEAVGHAIVREHMPDQHRELFAKLPTLLLGLQDGSGQPWATLLHGPSGFVSSPDAQTLRVAALPAADDPVAPWLREGAALGLLGLEPHTRRRNRANGRVKALLNGGFELQVLQSFGNCPKYIHVRRPQPLAVLPQPARRLGPALDAASVALLGRADTLFIASASGARPGAARSAGVDVSHRGGPPGFVHVAAAAEGLRLTLPDYLGNFFFNTLGNLLVWPRAGLLVPDLEDGGLLQLAAHARLDLDGPALAAFPGAQRLLHLDLLGGWWRPRALPLRWSAPEAPPQFA
jgi:predicted pyridoxine 5'-phosphate oxidase superfamily flavin-nucleotide-binding protein